MTRDSLPEFPDMAPVRSVSRCAFEEALPNEEHASDFQWLSVRAWNRDASAARLDGALVIRFADYHDPNRTFFSFTGSTNPASVAHQLLDACRTTSDAPSLHLIPAGVVSGLDVREFNCCEDRDNFDYVYSPEATAQAAGPMYKQLRRKSAAFEQGQHAYRIASTGPDDADVEGILKLTFEWSAAHADQLAAADEQAAVEECLNVVLSRDWLGELLVSHLYVGDVLAAYLIDEVRDRWAIGHFGHATPAVTGAAAYLRRWVARQLGERGVEWWNEEQDLGIAGLRQYKLGNRPSHFIRKYKVTRRRW